MKLLTKAEYERLSRVGKISGPVPRAHPDVAINEDLREQGRADFVYVTPHLRKWHITPAGREALRLWPLLVERGLVTP